MIRYLTLFFLLLLYACSPPAPSPSLGPARESWAHLPDSLPTAALADSLRLLPEAFTDSFFRERLLACYETMQTTCLQRLLQQYQSVRPYAAEAVATRAFFQGVLHQWGARYDSAELYYAHANDWFEKTTDTSFLCRILSSRSGNFAIQGNLAKDIALKFKVIALIGRDSAQLMPIRSMLANSLNKNADYEQAIQLITDHALAYFSTRQDTVGWAYALTVLGVAHFGKNQYQQASQYLQQALKLRHSQAPGISTGMRCESYYLYGRTLNQLGRYQEALDTLRIAELLAQNSPNRQGLTILDLSLGESLFHLGRFPEAERYLRQSLEVSRQRRQIPSALSAAQLLYQTAKAQGNNPAALRYLEQYGPMRDSMFGVEKEKIVRELSIQYDIREKENQIKSLQIQNQLATQRNAWIAGSLLLLFGALLLRYRIMALRKQEKLRYQKELAEARNAIMTQQLEAKEAELHTQRTRLADYAQMLIERNLRLQELSASLIASPGSTPAIAPQEWPGAPILTDADWEKFKQYFNSVYPDFVLALKTKSPKLSSAELRLVMLAKMGLSTKESAAMLGISIDAVKKGRYRLRKKLNLSGDPLADLL